jgi:DNA repair ATPase RecN
MWNISQKKHIDFFILINKFLRLQVFPRKLAQLQDDVRDNYVKLNAMKLSADSNYEAEHLNSTINNILHNYDFNDGHFDIEISSG